MLNKIIFKTIKLVSEKIIHPIIINLTKLDKKINNDYYKSKDVSNPECSIQDNNIDKAEYIKSGSYLADKKKKSFANFINKRGSFWKSATLLNNNITLQNPLVNLLDKARKQNKTDLCNRVNQMKSLLDSEQVDVPTPQINEDQ